MLIRESNWSQIEAFLKTDDRAVVPLGSTEQHAGLSLAVDSILSERVAAEAAPPLGVLVFPALAYGITTGAPRPTCGRDARPRMPSRPDGRAGAAGSRSRSGRCRDAGGDRSPAM